MHRPQGTRSHVVGFVGVGGVVFPVQAAAGACMFQHLGPPLAAAASPTAPKAEEQATTKPTATAVSLPPQRFPSRRRR